MSRLHKILIGIFCAGVLVTGIGVGVMFTEFTSLVYGGKLTLGETDMRTEDFDVEFQPGLERRFITGWYDWDQTELLTDASVPMDTVRFHVTYNAKRVAPFGYFEDDDITIYFHNRWIGEEDEIESMLKVKDEFLRNLKEGRLVSFETLGIEEVTVSVNPANEKDVRLVW